MSDFYYDRQTLRSEFSLSEFDYRNIDPRTYLRRLTRDIQEVTVGGSYKYTTEVPEGDNPAVTAENVGTNAGRVQGRLIARTNWEKFAGETREVESSPVGAIIAGLIGLVVMLAGFALEGDEQGIVIGFGILLLILAGLLYYFNSPNTKQSEYYYRKRVRILVRGEVAEMRTDDGPADLVASDLSLICSEEIEIEFRDSSGSQRVTRQELSPEARGRLESGYTPITSEINLEDGASQVYCQRVP